MSAQPKTPLLLSLLLSLLAACSEHSNAAGSACAGGPCRRGTRCDAATSLCVKDSPPHVALSTSSLVVSGMTVDVWGRASDDVGLALAQISDDNDGTWENVHLTDGRFEDKVPLPQLDSQPLVIGARVFDLIDQEASTTLLLTVDNVGPLIVFTGGTESKVAGASVEVTGSISDGSGHISHAVLAAAGAAGSGPLDLDDDGCFATTLRFPPGLEGTPRQVSVAAADAFGNIETASLELTVDTHGPSGHFITPAPGALLGGTLTEVVLEATDPRGVAAVRIDFGDGHGWRPAAQTGAGWSLAFALPREDGTPHVLKGELTDGLGNVSVIQELVTVDTVAPVVTIVSPSAGLLLGGPNQAAVPLSLTASDGTGAVLRVTASLGGTTVAAFKPGSGPSWVAALPLPAVDFVEEELVVVARDAAANEGSARVTVRVDRVAPVVSVVTPGLGAKLGVSAFPWGDDLTVSWLVTDGDPTAGSASFNGVATAAAARTGRIGTRPSDNPAAYAPTIVVRDSAGNEARTSAGFSVDRVSPTVTQLTPENRARNVAPRLAQVRFSEAVYGPTTSSGALLLSPTTAVGSWDATHQTFTTPPLEPYSVYSLALDAALADDHGNPVVAVPTRTFHTEAAIPATLPLTDLEDFSVTSDQDGVATVIGSTTNHSVVGFRVDPISGQPESQPLLPLTSVPGLRSLQALAWRSVNADGVTPSRSAAVTTFSSTPCGALPCPLLTTQHRVIWRDGAARTVADLIGSASASVVLAPPLAPAQDGTGDFGMINGTNYLRTPQPLVPLGVAGQFVAAGARRWAALEVKPSAIAFSDFMCTLDRSTLPPSPRCQPLTYTVPVGTQPPEFSAAMSPSGQCLAIAAGGTLSTFRAWRPPTFCTTATCTVPAPETHALGRGVAVAPFAAGGEDAVLVLTLEARGVQLWKLPSSAACDAPLAPLLPAPVALVGSKFRPVQLGNRAAIVYVDTASALKVFLP